MKKNIDYSNFFEGACVKVIMDGHNASDFHNLGRGVYNIKNWENTIFNITGEYFLCSFNHNTIIKRAYSLSLNGVFVGVVYDIALEITESLKDIRLKKLKKLKKI
jgi:hypothetical protein